MQKLNLVGQFRKISPEGPSDGGLLQGNRVDGRVDDWLARTEEGCPILLISIPRNSAPTPSIKLHNLAVEFGVATRIRDGRATVEGDFVILRCDSSDLTLQEWFLDICESLLMRLPIKPTAAAVHAEIRDVVELFKRLMEPPRNSLKGLWAELFIITESKSAVAWATAWHDSSMEKFDFSFPSRRVEVKATERPSRIHEFALEQLASTPSYDVVVASVLLRASSAGASVLDLARRVISLIDSDRIAVNKIWHNVAEALGNNFSDESSVRFDEPYARKNLRFISASRIPRPTCQDAGVFDIRFKIDISPIIVESGRTKWPNDL